MKGQSKIDAILLCDVANYLKTEKSLFTWLVFVLILTRQLKKKNSLGHWGQWDVTDNSDAVASVPSGSYVLAEIS